MTRNELLRAISKMPENEPVVLEVHNEELDVIIGYTVDRVERRNGFVVVVCES